MAPEGERAKKEQWIHRGYVWESCRKCLRDHKLGECTPKPNEPTLTCSEVVERLPEVCGKQMTQWNPGTGAMFCNSAPGHEGNCSYTFFFNNPPMPSEWRERRVQELPVLEKFEDEIAMHGGFGLTIGQLENLRAALVSAIGKATYPRNSEQIRKGAKHE